MELLTPGFPPHRLADGVTPRMVCLVSLALSVSLAAGCRAYAPADRAAAPQAGSAELIEYIGDEPYVTAESAYRAGYALAEGEGFDGDFDSLREALRTRKLIGDWPYTAREYIRKADVGFLICRACGIKTGINWNVTGLGRYAWRELIYHGIAQSSSEMGFISGGEFLGILLKAEEWVAERDPDRGSVPLDKPG